MANEKHTIPTIKSTPAKLKLDLTKVVNTVKSHFGKDKSSAAQVSTGASITKPSEDEDFIVWRNEDGSPSCWEQLTGIRGLPYSRVVQLAGRPDSSKSTHAMTFMVKAQQQNCVVILVDSENKFSKYRFEHFFGGNADELLITSSKMILEAGNQVEQMVHAIMQQNPDQKILIVWDSIGGSLAKNEGEDSLDQGKQLASAAKELGSLMRALTRLMEKYKNRETNKENIAVLLINQTYQNIGSVGSKESGGQKIEFYSSIIVQLSRKSDICKVKNGVKIKVGIEVRAKVKKNHLFDGEYSVSELPLACTASGISLLSEKKIKAGKETDAELVLEDEESED